MVSYWRLALGLLTALVALPACSADRGDENPASDDSEDPLTRVTASERAAAQTVDVGDYQLELATPTGTALFKAARYWVDHQLEDMRYPKPRRCAANVSKVSFLGGVERYDSEGVWGLLSAVKKADGSELFRLPAPKKRADGTLDKSGFVDMLNSIHGGRIPVGTFLAGCASRNCDAAPGEQHIAIIGHTDDEGATWIYHNNWYRPDNEGSRHGWKPNMIFTHFGQERAEELYNGRGLLRSWMATPWLKLKRDAAGKILDAESLMPAIDDMDPFGGAFGNTPKYFMTLAVMPEIATELSR